MLDDGELARRSLRGYGEALAALGRCSAGAAAELRTPHALGARCPTLPHSPWLAAVVVLDADAAPPAEETEQDALPCCVWSLAPHLVRGRVHDPALVMPLMGCALDAAAAAAAAAAAVEGVGAAYELCEPSFAEVAALNASVWDEPQHGAYAAVLGALGADESARTLGLRARQQGGGALACGAVTLTLGDDAGVHHVATDGAHRRRGLASALVSAMLARAAAAGARTATLQASAEGARLYAALGFRTLGTLRGFRRPDDAQASARTADA